MTIGVYLLDFGNFNSIYVGQSSNIEKRYKEHLYGIPKGRENRKLVSAYNKYGKPVLHILETCSLAELNSLEEYYINEFDAVNNGLNISVCSTANMHGEMHFNSIYTNEQIEEVFEALCKVPVEPIRLISDKTGVQMHTVQAISNGTAHSWLRNKYTDKYDSMLAIDSSSRRAAGRSAVALGIKYPNLLSPSGEVYSITNATEFARNNNLNASHVISVLNGKRKSHKGWVVHKGDIS